MNSDNPSGSYSRAYGNCLFLWLFLPALVFGIYIAVSTKVFYGLELYTMPVMRQNTFFRIMYLSVPYVLCIFSCRVSYVKLLLRIFTAVRASVIGYVFYSVMNSFGLLNGLQCVLFDFISALLLCELLDKSCCESCNNQSLYDKLYIILDFTAFAVMCILVLQFK